MRLVMLGVMILVAFGHPSFAEQNPPPAPENDPIYMRVMATPWPSEATVLVGNGGKHSAYELYVTNLGKTPLKITELKVQGKKDDEVVMTQSVAGKQLAALSWSSRAKCLRSTKRVSRRDSRRLRLQGKGPELT